MFKGEGLIVNYNVKQNEGVGWVRLQIAARELMRLIIGSVANQEMYVFI